MKMGGFVEQVLIQETRIFFRELEILAQLGFSFSSREIPGKGSQPDGNAAQRRREPGEARATDRGGAVTRLMRLWRKGFSLCSSRRLIAQRRRDLASAFFLPSGMFADVMRSRNPSHPRNLSVSRASSPGRDRAASAQESADTWVGNTKHVFLSARQDEIFLAISLPPGFPGAANSCSVMANQKDEIGDPEAASFFGIARDIPHFESLDVGGPGKEIGEVR